MIQKELNTFFSSPIAYLVIALYIIINGLFLFVFQTNFNILDSGFADLNAFFFLSPWIFVFLIPAITMRSFSDEIQMGTIELLKTKPMTNWQIVLGKFFGAVVLVLMMLAITGVYIYIIYQLANPVGNIDFSSIIGSYIGLTLIATNFISIGILTSSLSKNQITAFIMGLFMSFVLFYSFELMAPFFKSYSLIIKKIGLFEHYKSISRGVIEIKDVVYLTSINVILLLLTKMRVQKL